MQCIWFQSCSVFPHHKQLYLLWLCPVPDRAVQSKGLQTLHVLSFPSAAPSIWTLQCSSSSMSHAQVATTKLTCTFHWFLHTSQKLLWSYFCNCLDVHLLYMGRVPEREGKFNLFPSHSWVCIWMWFRAYKSCWGFSFIFFLALNISSWF